MSEPEQSNKYPNEQREQRDRTHDRHKNGRDPVRVLLNGCLGRLRLFDEAHNLAEGSVFANVGCFHREHTRLVDCATDQN